MVEKYQGDEVKIARNFTWSNIAPALPAEMGRVPLRDAWRYYVDHFPYFLKPPEQWEVKPQKVMVSDADWVNVCTGLVRAGICKFCSVLLSRNLRLSRNSTLRLKPPRFAAFSQLRCSVPFEELRCIGRMRLKAASAITNRASVKTAFATSSWTLWPETADRLRPDLLTLEALMTQCERPAGWALAPARPLATPTKCARSRRWFAYKKWTLWTIHRTGRRLAMQSMHVSEQPSVGPKTSNKQ